MIARKYINHFILLSLLFAGSGCSKQLNVYPTTEEVDGNVITDENSAANVLNGVYYYFAASREDNYGVNTTYWFLDHELVSGQLSGMISYYFGGGGLDEHQYNAQSSTAAILWEYAYKLINGANGFLKNITPATGIKASVKNEMIAEARFLRAYGHATALLYYGQYDDTTSAYGIILRNQLSNTSNVNEARSSVGASYDSIISDLDAAIADLPLEASAPYYANSWVAKLLKARVLINRGAAADYAEVISLTQDIIANGPFSLEANAKDIFWTNGLNSTEVMLGVQPFDSQNQKYTYDIAYGYYVPSSFTTSLFANDPRASWCLESVKTYIGTRTVLTKYYPGSVTSIAANAITENSYPFRLTEAYLLQAEAIVAAGGDMATAKTLLETVMSHAGITDFTEVENATTADEMQLLIVKEEMKNFMIEGGEDWFALRRLPFATIQSMLPSITSKSLLILPIPNAEMVTNPEMKQNPDY